MSPERPKLASCTPAEVVKAIRKIGGFVCKEGAKHTKIIHEMTGKASTIPRHGIVNKNLMKGFVNDFLIRELGYGEEEIYRYLWC